jgi:hypothetical protein
MGWPGRAVVAWPPRAAQPGGAQYRASTITILRGSYDNLHQKRGCADHEHFHLGNGSHAVQLSGTMTAASQLGKQLGRCVILVYLPRVTYPLAILS